MPKLCEFENCRRQATYGEFYGKPIRCNLHKEEYKLVSRLCQEGNCSKRASYNYNNETKAIYCSTHKLDNMIDIRSKRCEHEECDTRPSYNYEGQTKAIYCVSHKLDDMVDIKHKKCKANFCLGTRASDKYKGYCSPCFQHLFPNDPLSFQIRSKTKEIAVRDYINSIFTDFQHDLPLWTGNCNCTHRRRIDHRKLIGNTLLCIETDEHQHRSYNKEDEEIRYDDLFMLHGGKFIYIRFNPDKFKKNGKSCNPMLYTRLPVLKEEIEKQMNRIENEENTELLEIIKLFYDE